jgi:TM2 domain-containing membrane protein YozV
MKTKTTAAVLAFFLGGLGVHRFYLGQTGLGLVYLFFCWTLIPAIVAFIDFIVFLAMDVKAFDAKYNRPAGGPFLMQQHHSADELEKLFALKEKGIITEEEFQKRKASLL